MKAIVSGQYKNVLEFNSKEINLTIPPTVKTRGEKYVCDTKATKRKAMTLACLLGHHRRVLDEVNLSHTTHKQEQELREKIYQIKQLIKDTEDILFPKKNPAPKI